MRLLFYYDVCSQWSYFGDLTLDRLRERYGSDLDVEWRIAMVKDGKAIGYTAESLGWMYRRSESVTGIWVGINLCRVNSSSTWARIAWQLG